MTETTFRQATIHDADMITAIINNVVEEPNPVGFDGPTTPERVRTWLTRQGGEGARDKGFRRIRGRLPANNQTALSFLSGIGALVPMTNPEAVYELPLYEEKE